MIEAGSGMHELVEAVRERKRGRYGVAVWRRSTRGSQIVRDISRLLPECRHRAHLHFHKTGPRHSACQSLVLWRQDRNLQQPEQWWPAGLFATDARRANQDASKPRLAGSKALRRNVHTEPVGGDYRQSVPPLATARLQGS